MTVIHGSWMLLAPLQFVVLWVLQSEHSLGAGFARYREQLIETAHDVGLTTFLRDSPPARVITLLAVPAFISIQPFYWYLLASKLSTFSGLKVFSFFIAILTLAPYLREKRRAKTKEVALALNACGILIIVFVGTVGASNKGPSAFLGNLFAALGSVSYGTLGDALNRLIAYPEGLANERKAEFTLFIMSCVGIGTLILMVPVLIILHASGLETFEMPSEPMFLALAGSAFANLLFTSAFSILMTSMPALLCLVVSIMPIFLMPIMDLFLFGTGMTAANICGGTLISIALYLLIRQNYEESRDREPRVEIDD